MRSAIAKRISRRTFEKQPIPDREKQQIISLIETSNKESGLSIEFLENGSNAFDKITKSYGLFTNVRSIILMKGKQDLKHLKEKVGYYGEELVLALTDLDLGTCWVAGTFDKDALMIDDSEELICVVVVGVISGLSLKEKVVRSAIHRKVKPLEERMISDQPLPDWVEHGMKAVLLAPSAVNSQKTIFTYKNNVVSAHIANDSSTDLVDLGIAKKHFEIGAGGKFELGNGGVFHFD